jgi:hypothetical protein
MAVNVISGIMNNKEEEIMEFLAKTMNGIVKNYNLSLEKGSPELLWGNFGDIVMVTQVLKAIDKKNKDKLAQSTTE